MAITTFRILQKAVYIVLLSLLCSCFDEQQRTVGSKIIIYDWGKKLPEKAQLLEYGKDEMDEDTVCTYHRVKINFETDTLNREDYLAIDFTTPSNELKIKRDYKLIIDDSLVYILHAFKNIPKTQGGGIQFKVNNTYRSVPKNEPLTFFKKDMKP